MEDVADELMGKVLAGAKKLTVGRWAQLNTTHSFPSALHADAAKQSLQLAFGCVGTAGC